MVKKTKFNKTSIEKISNDKPVVYNIKTEAGRSNYVGSAKKGRVQDRLKEHLGKIPGSSVEIEQHSNINDARKKEKML